MPELAVTIIDARPATVLGRAKAAWQYRHYYPVLLKELSLRRFGNSILGYWMLLVRPLMPIIGAMFAFPYFIPVDTGAMPYPLFLISGYLGWNLFAGTMRVMPRALMRTRSLMRKMYLPKMLVPPASIGLPLINLGITLAAYLVVLAFFFFKDGTTHIHVGFGLLLFPVSLALILLVALSIGSVIGVLALLVRDIIFSARWIVSLLLFATPVLYPPSSLPQQTRWVFYAFNPLTAPIETARWSVTGFGDFHPGWLALSILEVGLITALCFTFFARAEAYLSDVV